MSLSVSFILGDGDTFGAGTPNRDPGGELYIAVYVNPLGHDYAAIQGHPAKLRELAAALTAAAAEADQWAESNPQPEGDDA